ncbi:hypothetical protein ABPG72_002673 [Tetrahymena utriculariae]
MQEETYQFQNTQEIGAQDYEMKILGCRKPVFLEFFADWCPPCKQLQAQREQIPPYHQQLYEYYQINVDYNQEFAEGFQLEGIPTVFLFYRGEMIDSFAGLDLKGFGRLVNKAIEMGSQMF